MADSKAPEPFSIPLFRKVWSANLASQFGALIQGVGAAWLMVQLGGSETQVALVTASVTLPIVFLALVAGAVADNYPRRLVMLSAQCTMFALSVVLCILGWMNALNPWLLLTFTFLIGCGTAMNAPAWQASVGDIVPRGTIAAAVAMNSMGFNIARSAGPALGGVIVAAFGAAAAFTFNAASYVGLIAVLLQWKPATANTSSVRESLGSAVMAGIHYVSLSPPIRRTMLRGALFGVAGSSVSSLMPLVARDLVSGGAATFGILSGAFGVGAVVGALSTRHLRGKFSSEATVRLSVSLVIIGGIVIGLSRFLPLTLIGLLLVGAGWLISVATMNVVVQMSAPRWVVGRALSLFQMAIFGAMAFSSWTSGSLAGQFGAGNALLIMAGVQATGLAIGVFFPLPRLQDINLDPIGSWTVPSTQVPVEARSGPIRIALRYKILESDIPKFLSAMIERRRVRRRDGARSWSLSRDLSDPDTWIEQYSFARWQDYVLHNERRTHADDESLAAIRALHQGSWPPEVSRFLERQLAGFSSNPAQQVDSAIGPIRDS